MPETKAKKNTEKKSNKTSHALNISYLGRLIKNRGLTHQALSKLVPCSTVSIHKWVTGQQEITKKKLNALAEALGVDPCSLLETDDKRTLKYLRDLVNKKIEHDSTIEDDLPLIDIPTLLAIAKLLGYEQKTDLKVTFNTEEFKMPRNVEAEDQMKALLGVTSENNNVE